MDKTSNMDNTTKKVIFLDIDGTLAIPGETVPVPSALDVIRKARKKGQEVIVSCRISWNLVLTVLLPVQEAIFSVAIR